jgi:uncharacterized lipoprotein YmbA
MRRRDLIALLLLAPVACSSPNPALYTLAAVPGPEQHSAVRSVELRRIGLAGYLDRGEIVRSAAQYRLDIASNDRWGEPLGSMLDRVFTENLVQRLPGTAVFTESGAITTRPDRIVEIDVQRFDADASGTVVLLAQVAVRREDARIPGTAETVRLTSTPASPATRDLVAAMSAALGKLADMVASRLAR